MKALFLVLLLLIELHLVRELKAANPGCSAAAQRCLHGCISPKKRYFVRVSQLPVNKDDKVGWMLKGEGFTTAKGEFQIHLNVGMDRLLVIPSSGTYKLEVHQITGANGIRQQNKSNVIEIQNLNIARDVIFLDYKHKQNKCHEKSVSNRTQIGKAVECEQSVLKGVVKNTPLNERHCRLEVRNSDSNPMRSNWNTSLMGEGQTNDKGAFKILLKIGFELLDGFDQLFIFVKCLDRQAESSSQVDRFIGIVEPNQLIPLVLEKFEPSKNLVEIDFARGTVSLYSEFNIANGNVAVERAQH